MRQAALEKTACVIVVPVAPDSMSHGYKSWWRVAVAEVSEKTPVQQAYQQQRKQCEMIP